MKCTYYLVSLNINQSNNIFSYLKMDHPKKEKECIRVASWCDCKQYQVYYMSIQNMKNHKQ